MDWIDFQNQFTQSFQKVSGSLEFSARLTVKGMLMDLWDEVFDRRNIGFSGADHGRYAD